MENQKKEFGMHTLSRRIPLEEARTSHINYLEHGPHIYAKVGGQEKIVHSFLLNRDNLEALYSLAENGLRLYLCRNDVTKNYINIIAVPVKNDNDNNVRTILSDGQVAITNTLEPCPNICSLEFSENDLNCRKSEGAFYWLKPNNETEGKVWFRVLEDAVEPTDKPEGPYEE